MIHATTLINTLLLIGGRRVSTASETSPEFSVEKVSEPRPAVRHESGPLSRITSKSTKPQSLRFARVAEYRGGCIKFDEVFAVEAPKPAFRSPSFLFLSPAKRRRGKSRKTIWIKKKKKRKK